MGHPVLRKNREQTVKLIKIKKELKRLSTTEARASLIKPYTVFSFTRSCMAGVMQEGDKPFSILQGMTIGQWAVLYTGL